MTNRHGFYFRSLCLTIILLIACRAANSQVSSVELEWPRITSQTKPWTRWWWLGGILDQRDLTIELEKYQKAGIGGLEITPIYGVKGYEDRFLDFLSPRWMEMLSHSLNEAERLGLGVDLATGTGWPFGGQWVNEEDACKNFVYKIYRVTGGGALAEDISYIQKPLVRAIGRKVGIAEVKSPISANKNLQALALDQVRFQKPLPLQTLMAYSDNGETLDLTARVGAGGKLDWIAPKGNWTLYAIFQGLHGKMVERAGPGGEGDVIDHFSDRALKNYLNKFDRSFAGHKVDSIRAFFNDSYEVDDAEGDANWTPDYFEEFKKRRGYDLRLHLPALLGKDEAEKNSRVLSDYRETISELLLDKFTIPWRRWAAGKGAIIRNQSHGAPANLLDLYAASDIPETEGQDILRMKFASSAANVSGKQLASAEAATWLGEHFSTTLGEVKDAADRYFLGGINHLCYHGTPYSPQSVEWPGWLFYASVHFGPTNSFWNDFPALNAYIARCQSFLQSGRSDNDILLYYPIYDSWAQSGRSLLQHYGGGFDSAMNQADAEALMRAGYSFDLFSDRQLADFGYVNGEIRSAGNSYKVIIVPAVKFIPLATFERVLNLAKRGATVVIHGSLPADVSGYGDVESRRKKFMALKGGINLKRRGSSDIESAKYGEGWIHLGKDLGSLLEISNVRREPMIDGGLQFVRRKYEKGKHYFIVNPTGSEIAAWVPLRSKAGSVAIFDPMSVESGLGHSRVSHGGGSEVYLRLAPGQSLILKTLADQVRGERFEFFEPAGEAQPITGVWSLEFIEGGPELPASLETRTLGSWTDFDGEAVRKFSGAARYSISFDKPAGESRRLLDLGKVAESARVRLNGRDLGTLIKSPFKVMIPDGLLRDRNTLEIFVSNLMANRIADMDRRGVKWKKFYNINFPSRRPENRGADGLFDASRWLPRDSGLIGPVTLTPVRPME